MLFVRIIGYPFQMDQQVIIVFIDINSTDSITNSIDSNYVIFVINSIINFKPVIIIGVIKTIDSIKIINLIIAINPVTIINSILIDLYDLSIRLEQANQTFIRIQINLSVRLKFVSSVPEGLSPF